MAEGRVSRLNAFCVKDAPSEGFGAVQGGESLERLGAPDPEAEQPQTSLRRTGPQAGASGGLRGPTGATVHPQPALHADHRRGVPLAGTGGDRDTVNEGGAKDSGSAQSGNPVPAGTVAEAIPRDLLLGRTNIRDCA